MKKEEIKTELDDLIALLAFLLFHKSTIYFTYYLILTSLQFNISYLSFIFSGPSGEPLLFLQGEGHYDTLRLFISIAVAHYSDSRQLSRSKLDIISTENDGTVVKSDVRNRILNYPGKVVISGCGNLMAVADSANHRIIVADLKTGEILVSVDCVYSKKKSISFL